MGLFDGYLLCSDFDGTMAHEARVSQENCDAIAYFQKEGGIFCPTSGRLVGFFGAYADRFCLNGPVVTLNGSVISEYAKDSHEERMLYIGGTPRALTVEFLQDALKLPGIQGAYIYTIGRCMLIPSEDRVGRLSECEDVGSMEDIPESVQKIVLYHDMVHLSEIRAYLEPKYGDRLFLGSSWERGYEAQLIGTEKGSAALRVKEMVGAHTLVAVGDYGNDIPMLKAADIGYAVENALDEVKAAADRITVSCTDHAIARIVEDLKRDIMKKGKGSI